MRTFCASTPVFTRKELEESLQANNSSNRNTSNSRLAHHFAQGMSSRSGVVSTPECQSGPILIPSHRTPG